MNGPVEVEAFVYIPIRTFRVHQDLAGHVISRFKMARDTLAMEGLDGEQP